MQPTVRFARTSDDVSVAYWAHGTGGEILVSSTVKDLVAGSDIAFGDRRLHSLKGVPGEWHLFSLRSP